MLTDLDVMTNLDALEELLLACTLACRRWVVIDLEVVAEELRVAVDILVFDLIDDARDLLNALMDGANNAVFCDCIFHLVDGDVQKFFSGHWHTVFDSFTDGLHS